MENSAISWTHHTFNPVRGCAKVSAGCQFCYAETLSKRNPGTLGIWGVNGTRVVASEAQWKLPLKWDKAAQAAGGRHRVFCASLSDVFEDRPEWEAPRLRLFDLIRQTPSLDWLILTKRPENIVPMLDRALYKCDNGSNSELAQWLADWLNGAPPHNVWFGTSVENQDAADERIPHLLSVPAAVRFLSCEPLLGEVRLTDVNASELQKRDLSRIDHDPLYVNALTGECDQDNGSYTRKEQGPSIHWVICGGESGPNARPMHPDWARSLRDQCAAAGVAFHFKQHGEYIHESQTNMVPPSRVVLASDTSMFYPVGKHRAGRLLDGKEHNEFPSVAVESGRG